MRVLMLANPDSVHTLKWVRGLSSRGVEVLLLGLQAPRALSYAGLPGVRLETAGVPARVTRGGEWSAAKLAYLAGVRRARALARAWRPDVVHAHYLTSYGLVGALAGLRPLLVSVWGADIYENPDRSWLHRRVARFALARADRVSATSQVMARRTRAFTAHDVRVIPFGIDPAVFAPGREATPFAPGDLVIGTVKTMHPKYGISVLIEAFARLVARHPALPLRLLLVGGGPQLDALRALAARLGVGDRTHFTGQVAMAEVPRHHRMIDIYAALSTLDSESFGVAVIEAGASGRPVVVSDVGGLPEVVRDGETGLIVPRNDATAAADALERLVLDPALRARLGAAGRAHVTATYDFDRNLDQMLALYAEMAPGAAR